MNFLTEGIGTTISVNQVESDGYEAKNLLGSDLNLNSSSGFLVESFVHPPVTLSIKFPLCIELSHIVINPKLGKQITSAFLIHTETSYKSWTKEHNGPVSSHLVAKEYINTSPIPNVIVFRNPRFVLRRPFSSLPMDHYGKHRNSDTVYNLKHPSFNACERVVGLEITILKVAGSSVPALGGLQVWGQPCIRCGQDQVEKLYKHWTRILLRGEANFNPPLHSTDSSDEGVSAPKKPKLIPSSAKVSVPDDFLDAITYEIMCQPIRLPCGLAVDAQTLEKYYAEEANFGRLPNDPFTGITFTESFKPLADAALKSRIDVFLTQNSEIRSLANIPRTLGSNRTGTNRGNYVFRNPNSNSVSTVRSNISSSTFSPNDFFDLGPFGNPFEDDKLYPQISSKPKATVSSLGDMNREEKMNYELFKILSAGSSYLAKPPGKPKQEKKCKDCGLHLSMTNGISTFYIGLCDHVILCRICLSKTEKQTLKKCTQCGVEWRAKDCLRIFI